MAAKKKTTKKTAKKKAAAGSLDATYAALRAILEPHARTLRVGKDDATWLEVLTSKEHQGKPVWFGAVRKGKGYVSFYLMPMYVTPQIAAGMSPALARRRQGKSCFHFTAPDRALFAELRALTARGLEAFRAQGLA